MASSAFECEVCNEDYNSNERKPLCLPCGHSFCHGCLSRDLATANKCCPRCKLAVEHNLESLPVIYALISPPKVETPELHCLPSADLCESHGSSLEYFCADCGDIVCRKCVKQSHAQHRVEFIDDMVDRDELSTKFVTDLDGQIQTKVDHLSMSLSRTNKISQTINAMKVNEVGLLKYKALLKSLRASTTRDLSTWKDKAPKSVEEKRKMFKILCQHWKDKGKTLPDEQMQANFLQKLDDLTAHARKVQKETEDLKSHMKKDITPIARTFFTEEPEVVHSTLGFRFGLGPELVKPSGSSFSFGLTGPHVEAASRTASFSARPQNDQNNAASAKPKHNTDAQKK